jgi:hypothetical protein
MHWKGRGTAYRWEARLIKVRIIEVLLYYIDTWSMGAMLSHLWICLLFQFIPFHSSLISTYNVGRVKSFSRPYTWISAWIESAAVAFLASCYLCTVIWWVPYRWSSSWSIKFDTFHYVGELTMYWHVSVWHDIHVKYINPIQGYMFRIPRSHHQAFLRT